MVPVGDVAAMAAALLETLEDDHQPSSYLPLMKHLQKFEVQNVAKKYVALFDSLRR